MKITIIGCGSVGSAIAGLCSKIKEIDEIVIADIDGKKIKKTSKDLNKITKKHIIQVKIKQAGKKSFLPACEGSFFVINASTAKNNVPIAKTCLRKNSNYIDLVSEVVKYSKMPKTSLLTELKKLDKKFKKKKLIGVTNAGLSPGISDIITYQIFDKIHPKRIKKVSILLADIIISKELVTSWSPETLFLETLSPPTIWKNGRIIESDHKKEMHTFLKPVGRKKVYTLSGHPELITITENSPIKIEELTVKAAFEIKKMDLDELVFYALRKMAGEISTNNIHRVLHKAFIPPHKFEQHLKKSNITEELGAVEVIVEYIDPKNKMKKYGLGANYSLKKAREIIPFTTTAAFGSAVLPATLIELVIEKKIRSNGIVTCSQLREKNAIMKKLKKFGIITKKIA